MLKEAKRKKQKKNMKIWIIFSSVRIGTSRLKWKETQWGKKRIFFLVIPCFLFVVSFFHEKLKKIKPQWGKKTNLPSCYSFFSFFVRFFFSFPFVFLFWLWFSLVSYFCPYFLSLFFPNLISGSLLFSVSPLFLFVCFLFITTYNLFPSHNISSNSCWG